MTTPAAEVVFTRAGERRRPDRRRLREARLAAGVTQRVLGYRAAERLGTPAKAAQFAQALARAEAATPGRGTFAPEVWEAISAELAAASAH